MKTLFKKFLLCVAVCIAATTVGLPQTGVQITINPSPTLYSVMGGGSYCAGQAGVTVSLSNSEVGVNYQLVCNGLNLGLPFPGNGTVLNFGTQTMGGVYTVIATNPSTGCSIQMSNSATIQVNAIPNVTITTSGPTIFCGSGTVTLTANAGGGCTYQWKMNGTIIPGANLNQYVANQTGMFTVVATNGFGCSNDHDTMVMVNPLPQAFTVSASSPTFCEGGTGVTINLNGSQTGVNYQLLLNGVNSGVPVGGTGIGLAWTNQAVAGVYSIVATDNSTSCTNVMNGSAVVAMDPLPGDATIITGPTTICQGSTVSFSTNPLLNATSYLWSVPAGANVISGQGTTMITVFINGTSGDISVIGVNSCGSGQAYIMPIIVNIAPTNTITATYSDICAGASTDLTSNGTGVSFVWTGGMITQTVTVNPTATTTYIVTATGTNGCTATDDFTVTVHALPTVSLTLAQDNYCTDVNSAVISGGLPAGGTYSGSCVFGGNTVYPPVSGPGTYTVTYTYTDGFGCSAFATDLLTINPIPTVTFSSIVGAVYTDTPPFDLMGNVSPIGGTFSGPGMVGSLFDPAAAGAGTWMLTYTYVHPITGCSASQIQYITVGTTGVEEVSAAVNAATIYPNPAISLLNIAGIDTKEIKSIRIMNVLGEVVFATETVTENMQLNVSGYAPGTYVIGFMNADGLSVGKYFIKTQ